MLQTRGEVRIVLTGGHAATTAIAVVEEIKSERKDWEIYWIGVKKAIEGKKIVTLEFEALPKLGVKFLNLITGRLQTRFTVWTIPSILKIPVGFVQSFYYLVRIRPSVVLSFGGFASFPVVFGAKLMSIPIIVHEQTSEAGRTNLLSVKFASKIALSRKESLKYYPREKCVVTGNPVMKEITKIKPKKVIGNPPTIFVTGGSRGSQNINSVVEGILRTLLSKYKVIHQTGGLDYKRFADIRQKLPQALRDNYEVFTRINPFSISEIYEKADIVVARAGANTISEIIAVCRPAILIPLPISYLNEQNRNAQIAEKWGIAKILPQKNLRSQALLKEIENTVLHFTEIVVRASVKKSPDLGASRKVIALVEEYLK